MRQLALAPILALTLLVAFSPGLFLATPAEMLILIAALAIAASLITRSRFGATLVIATFVIGAAIVVVIAPVVARFVVK